jgi:hypothetical protein
MCELHHWELGCDRILCRYSNSETVCVADDYQYIEIERRYATDIERYCHIMLAKFVRTNRTNMHLDCALYLLFAHKNASHLYSNNWCL